MTTLEEKIINAKSDEEFMQIMADAGMPVTAQQLHAAARSDSELQEDALEMVSGGMSMSVIRFIGIYLDRGRYTLPVQPKEPTVKK